MGSRSKMICRSWVVLLGLAVACGRDTSNLKQIQQERAGEYQITLLNHAGQVKQGPNRFVLEFRKTSDRQLTNVGNVEITSVLPKGPLPDRVTDATVKSADEAGRYSAAINFPVPGAWAATLLFGNGQSAVLGLTVQ